MSGYVIGERDRYQLGFMPVSYDDMIDENNPVRAIDALVNSFDMNLMGFRYAVTKSTGRNPFNPADMLKLYLYGYFNSIRSSRKLEKETLRNIEVMWLTDGLTPDFRTISDFRKANITILKKVFKQFSILCDELGLYGKEIVAIDGSKFRANNARKKNYTKGKIAKQLQHFEESAKKYLELLEASDKLEKDDETIKLTKIQIQEKIENAQKRIAELTELSKQVEENGEISLTDPDARHMNANNNGTDIAHNVQIAVDSKHHLVVVVDVTSNAADQGQLYNVASQAKEALGVEELTVLADKGYYVGEDLKKCEDDGIETIVSRPKAPSRTGNEEYTKDKFTYNADTDEYTCPKGEILHRIGIKDMNYINRDACKNCPNKGSCTTSSRGRTISRSEYEEVYERTDERFDKNKELYKKRQETVEHPFGTVKRAFGYTHFLLRRTEKVLGESVIHFLVYNLKRVINILGTKELVAAIMA